MRRSYDFHASNFDLKGIEAVSNSNNSKYSTTSSHLHFNMDTTAAGVLDRKEEEKEEEEERVVTEVGGGEGEEESSNKNGRKEENKEKIAFAASAEATTTEEEGEEKEGGGQRKEQEAAYAGEERGNIAQGQQDTIQMMCEMMENLLVPSNDQESTDDEGLALLINQQKGKSIDGLLNQIFKEAVEELEEEVVNPFVFLATL
jgi:hypothetical protein